MSALTDHFRDQFHLLLMYQCAEELPKQPVLSMPPKPKSEHERHLSCSMQQLQSVLADVSRVLDRQPELAREWRNEFLECGRSINFAIQQATSRMRTLGAEEYQGRGP